MPSLQGAADDTTFPVPLHTGHFWAILESPTIPVPRQLLQSVWIAGAGFASVISEYLPATATNGRRSSVALEQPHKTTVIATKYLDIAECSVGRVLTPGPAGHAGECDTLAAVNRVSERPVAPLGDEQIGAEHLASTG